MMPSQGLCKQGPSSIHTPLLKWDLGSLTSGSGKHLSKQIGPAGRRRRGSAAQAVASAPVWLGALGSSPGAEASRPHCRSDCRCPAGAAPNLSRSIIATAAFSFCGSVSGGGATLLIPPSLTHPDEEPSQCAIICYSCAPLPDTRAHPSCYFISSVSGRAARSAVTPP